MNEISRIYDKVDSSLKRNLYDKSLFPFGASVNYNVSISGSRLKESILEKTIKHGIRGAGMLISALIGAGIMMSPTFYAIKQNLQLSELDNADMLCSYLGGFAATILGGYITLRIERKVMKRLKDGRIEK